MQTLKRLTARYSLPTLNQELKTAFMYGEKIPTSYMPWLLVWGISLGILLTLSLDVLGIKNTAFDVVIGGL